MSNAIELELTAKVNDMVAGMKKAEDSVSDLSDAAKDASKSLDSVATSSDKAGGGGGIVAAGMQAAQTGLAAAAQGAKFLGAELAVLAGAFDQAEKAAKKYGDVKVTAQIEGMHTSLDSAIGALLALPIAGRGVLDWMGDAADGAGNAAKLIAVLSIKFREMTGEIDATTAATLAAKLANDDFAKSNDDLIPTIDAAKKALQAARQANFEATGYYGNFKITGGQGGYQISGPNGNPLPGRAAGGPVMAGRAYMVGEKGPETFIPPTNGTITPNGAGGNLTVVIQAGAFMGERADALRLANQLAPEIQRALKRTAAGGYQA